MRQSDDSLISKSHHRTKHSWTRDQLLRKLEILGPLHDPPPPTLPPSPPASRSASPVTSSKRKYDTASDHENFKRPRTGSVLSDRPFHPHNKQQQHSHPPQVRVPGQVPLPVNRHEPCEDGELREDPVIASSSRLPATLSTPLAPNIVPIRRPKRGKTDYRHHDALHDKYHDAGRKLKYSGDARFWSTYPTTHREYRPLADPPPPNSPYHKHGGLIARLELVDALVCFTYAIWNKDYGRRNCYRTTWRTIDAFLSWCKAKWLAEEGILDAEKAFIGLIFMIEGFIHARKLAYLATSQLEKDISLLYEEMKAEVAQAATKGEQEILLAPKSQAPSAMLPSPASIAPANSANSTPITRDDGTPNATASVASGPPQRAAYHPGQNIISEKLLPECYRDSPIPAHVMDAMVAATISIGPALAQNLKEQTLGTTSAGYAMNNAQNSLNLSTLVRFFPNTFARVVYTTLSPTDEHEPDFEDEEGELFWPGQCISGEGLGWVCLMGKAMIKEFGKAYGYRGLDGVVPKPKPEEEDGNRAPMMHAQSQPQRPGSTPHGHTPHGHLSQASPSSSLLQR